MDQLIRTKLHLPFTRPGLVLRSRLKEQIARGLRGPLTLVTAPAGFGKTTLVASSVAGCEMPVAWLSLDKEDNQLWRFLRYLIAALQEINPQIGSGAAELLAAAQQEAPEIILTRLINDLDGAGKELVLVLDDYHRISSHTIHEKVAFLLEHCPANFHLLLSTRSDPPLPLARLRARGQTVELRTADLRFTELEAARFLNDVMDLKLDERSVAVLEERTEGWIAGLQMASIALQAHHSMHQPEDAHGFIQGFSGTNRYILDYLLEEALSNQPPEIQRFLLHTSILERLTAPLCEALLAESDEPKAEGGDQWIPPAVLSPSRSASMLEYIERANLFLIPLDHERRWYRYHHLFSDLLRARLALSQAGQYQNRLHARASEWFEKNGFAEEAIHHALAAGEYEEAARQMEAAAESTWLNGQYTNILAWVKALPTDLVHSRPWLCIWCAWVYTQMGISQGIQEWIEAARLSAKKPPWDAPALMNEIAALKVFAVSFSKDYAQAIELAESVLKGPPLKHEKASEFIRCNILHVLSSMYFSTGQLRKAEQTCQQTIELAHRIGFTLRYIHAINKLIFIYMVTGRLARCDQKLDETQSVLREQGNSNYFAALQLYFRRIELLYEWNRLDEARRLVDWILSREMMVELPYLVVDFSNIQAALLLTKGDYTGAQNLLNKATALAQQSYIWEGLTGHTQRLQVWLWLKKGAVSQAAAWAAQQTERTSAVVPVSSEEQMLAQARIFLAQNAWQNAIALLKRLSDPRKSKLIEIQALKAMAFQGAGEEARADAEIESALTLAAPEGYVRTFIDEGRPMQMLITQWLAHNDGSPLRAYAKLLLSQLNADQADGEGQIAAQPTPAPAESTTRAAQNALHEPLSQRELEVLRLIALGKTNEEIARQFVVARGTIKAQAASIYRKLDVGNRTEAVARARQLGILS